MQLMTISDIQHAHTHMDTGKRKYTQNCTKEGMQPNIPQV